MATTDQRPGVRAGHGRASLRGLRECSSPVLRTRAAALAAVWRPCSRLRQFEDDGFQDAFDAVLGAAYHRAADIGEALATAGRVQDGDADSWLREWTATAGSAWAAAGRAERDGHRASALEHHLRAGTYYAAALRHVALTDQSVNDLDLWRRQRECWDRAVALFPVPGEQHRDPLRAGRRCPGTSSARPERAPGRAAPTRGAQQRHRHRHVRRVAPWRRGRGRSRLPLDDVRRPGPAGRAACARDCASGPTGRRC